LDFDKKRGAVYTISILFLTYVPRRRLSPKLTLFLFVYLALIQFRETVVDSLGHELKKPAQKVFDN
jgi:hypothetical protein